MKSAILVMVVGLCLATGPMVPAKGPDPQLGQTDATSSLVGYVPNEFIVVLAEDASPLQVQPGPTGRPVTGWAHLDKLAGQFAVTHMWGQFAQHKPGQARNSHRQRLSRHYKVRFSRGQLAEAMQAYRTDPAVDHVEPIGIHRVYLVPNDTYYDNPPVSFPYDQWHYWATYGIDAPQAWDRETGDSDVVVAVLDTGVKYTHTDLGGINPPGPADNSTQGNIWVNTAETPADGLDNDGNGLVDDVIGWDFVTETGGPGITCLDADCAAADNDPTDGAGHGTHVAGTIAAITNNGFSVAGIAGGFAAGTVSSPANGCRLMCLRIGYRARVRVGNEWVETGIVRMDSAAQAMVYVGDQVAQGVRATAINCSWGSSNTGGLDAAVDYLLSQDVMVVHAAGNDGINSADYLGSKAGVVNVAATDSIGAGASFTNYGSWVDIAAPGVDIMSTYHEPDDPDTAHMYVGLLSGTSMAAPHVCGVAALLESFCPSLSGPDKLALMLSTSTPYVMDGRDLGAGIVNAAAALAQVSPPPAVAQITAQAALSCGQAVVSWTPATGATGYYLYYQEASATPPFLPFQDGTPASGADVGAVAEVTIAGLNPLATYYFAVRAYNAYGLSDYSPAPDALPNTACQVHINGHLYTFDGHGIGGVLLTAQPGGASTLTDPNGLYLLDLPLGWSDGQIQPTRAGWWFEPTVRSYPTTVLADLASEDYVGFRRADFDDDGDVDLSDVALLAERWLATDCAEPDWCGGADMNVSGAVELTDLGLLLEQWFGSY